MHNSNFEVNPLLLYDDFSTPMRKKLFENILEKGENADDQHFLLLPRCFLPYDRQIKCFELNSNFLSANAFNLDKAKIMSCGKRLKLQLFAAYFWTKHISMAYLVH